MSMSMAARREVRSSIPSLRMTFFFSSRRRHTRFSRDWSSDCALPISPRRFRELVRRGGGRAAESAARRGGDPARGPAGRDGGHRHRVGLTPGRRSAGAWRSAETGTNPACLAWGARGAVMTAGESRYLPIGDHGLIGDLRTVALVGTNGTVDWYCCPRFDAPSVFAAILDADRGGSFELAADAPARTKQFYFPDTNVLITRFFADDGVGRSEERRVGDGWT